MARIMREWTYYIAEGDSKEKGEYVWVIMCFCVHATST